jgi:3-oxoacyl-(acyl-carrier-protein) synthase
MKKCYINGAGCVSSQNTFESAFLSDITINEDDNVLFAVQPSYKEFIAPGAIRRMAKGVKMGIAASSKALKEAGIQIPDAIITGTGMGCVEDSEKFLKAILDNQEEFLTPTSFIQSTHNTVGGQIALGLQCKGYNFTYVNGAVSFESALLDAKMQIENDEANNILIGGVDETSAHTIELFKLIHLLKSESDKPYSVKKSNSKGYVLSEGASFFVVENQKNENSYAEVSAVKIQNHLNIDDVNDFVKQFLNSNNLSISDIDAVVLGNNGDVAFDNYYEVVSDLFTTSPQVYYKHLCGEYNTASAFGFWAAVNVLKNQQIPDLLQLNSIKKEAYKTILLYNQFRGKDHSLTILQKC